MRVFRTRSQYPTLGSTPTAKPQRRRQSPAPDPRLALRPQRQRQPHLPPFRHRPLHPLSLASVTTVTTWKASRPIPRDRVGSAVQPGAQARPKPSLTFAASTRAGANRSWSCSSAARASISPSPWSDASSASTVVAVSCKSRPAWPELAAGSSCATPARHPRRQPRHRSSLRALQPHRCRLPLRPRRAPRQCHRSHCQGQS
jgi:hypothetical protein